jgi:hypothetical protein
LEKAKTKKKQKHPYEELYFNFIKIKIRTKIIISRVFCLGAFLLLSVCTAGGQGEMRGPSRVQAPEFELQMILSFGFMQFGRLLFALPGTLWSFVAFLGRFFFPQ